MLQAGHHSCLNVKHSKRKVSGLHVSAPPHSFQRSMLSTVTSGNGRQSEGRGPLDDKFYKLKTWEEVEGMVSNLGTNATAVHLCAAFNRLKKLPIPPPQRFLDELAEKIVNVLPEMNGWHYTTLLHACGKLWYTNSRYLDVIIQSAHEAIMVGKFKSFHIGWCMYSVGVLRKRQRKRESLAEFDEDFEEVALDRAFIDGCASVVISSGYEQEFSCRCLANAFYGLGLLGCRNIAFLHVLSSEASRKERLDGFNEQEIAMIILSMGRLKFNHKGLVLGLREELMKAEVLREFREQGLSMIMYGIARSRMFMPPQVLRCIVWEVCRPHRLQNFLSKQLALIVYSLGVLGVKNPKVYDRFLGEIDRPGRSDRGSIHPRIYATMLHAIARARVAPAMIISLVKLLTINENVCRLTEQGLSNTVYSLGLLSGDVEFPFVSPVLCEEVSQVDRLEKYTEQHLSNILYGLGRGKLFKYWDTKSLEKLVEEILRPHRIPEYKDQGLANVIFALAQIGIVRLDYHKLMAAEALHRIDRFSNEGLAMIVYSWGSINFQDETAVGACLEEAVKVSRLRGFSEQGLSNVLFGLLRMGCRSKPELRLIMHEIEYRVLPKFKYVVRPEFLMDLIEADVVDEATRQKLKAILKVTLLRFEKEGLELWDNYRDKKLKLIST